MAKKRATQRSPKHRDLPTKESKGQPPEEVTKKDVCPTSLQEAQEPSEMEMCDGGAEKEAPAFTLSVGNDGAEPRQTLYVYKNKASSGTQVTINVVSVTPEMTGDQEGTGHTDDGEKQEDELPMIDETEPLVEDREAGKEPQTTVSEKTVKDQAQYSCSDCDFMTTKKHAFHIHKVMHAKPDKKMLYHCPECSYSSPHRFNIKTHLKRHADLSELDESEKFKCKDCDYITMYKHDLMTHAKKHDPEQQFRCFHCDFTSIYRHSLLHHISSKHGKARPYQCSKCSYTSARKQDLKIHMWRHSEEKKFKCTEPECDYETPYKLSFKSHMNRHKGIKPFQCSWAGCSFSTTTKGNLRSHLKRHESRLHCETCNFETASAEKLAGHVCVEKDVTSDKKKDGAENLGPVEENMEERKKVPFEPKGVKNSAGQMEYQCTECNYKTSKKCRLKQHFETHDWSRKPPPKIYTCEYCAYQTGYQNSLKRHMARHSLVKPLKCGHCNYSAINMSQMRVHIAKHTGVKPYKCNVCSYATANKQHLVVHMCKHSNLRFKCNSCDYMTAWSARMRIHLKRHLQTTKVPCKPTEQTSQTKFSMFDITPPHTKIFLVENLVANEDKTEIATAGELEGMMVAEQLGMNVTELKEGSGIQEIEDTAVLSETLVLSHGTEVGNAQEPNIELVTHVSAEDGDDVGTGGTLVIAAECAQNQVNAGSKEEQLSHQSSDDSSVIGQDCYIVATDVLAQPST